MSGKFGLTDDQDEIPGRSEGKINLSGFSPVRKRSPVNLAEIDAAAAPHGFISRESTPTTTDPILPRRRQRKGPAEPARQLSLRLVDSQYFRFIAFADRYQLTYHDALIKLLDDARE